METQNDSLIAYPSQFENEVVLTDGSAMILRPIKVMTSTAGLAFYPGLVLIHRYFVVKSYSIQMTPEDAQRFCRWIIRMSCLSWRIITRNKGR